MYFTEEKKASLTAGYYNSCAQVSHIGAYQITAYTRNGLQYDLSDCIDVERDYASEHSYERSKRIEGEEKALKEARKAAAQIVAESKVIVVVYRDFVRGENYDQNRDEYEAVAYQKEEIFEAMKIPNEEIAIAKWEAEQGRDHSVSKYTLNDEKFIAAWKAGWRPETAVYNRDKWIEIFKEDFDAIFEYFGHLGGIEEYKPA